MNWRIPLICALLVASLSRVRAAEPISFREIAMLLRNGEDPQFIVNDTARRKLLQPLSQEEEQTLVSLHAPAGLLTLLHDPTTLASPDAAAAFAARVQQQKQLALQEERLAARAAATALLPPKTPKKAGPPAQPGPGTGSEYVGKPLNLKFNAADGAPIDLSRMHGKVVLVDFWATWCGPCMKEVPNVTAAYAKYKSKGFEVVGISLDHDKDAMLQVAAQKGMTWPQYFDGKGWENEISTAYHIRAIPTMWLINKNGLIATTEARGNLDAAIEKLLAE